MNIETPISSRNIHRYDINLVGRDFVVGDIHGMFGLLKKALKLVDFKVGDRLFCVGDLVDRGPESHESLDFIDFLRKTGGGTVLGNHDQMLKELLFEFAFKKNIQQTMPSSMRWIFRQPYRWRQKMAAELNQLPLAIEVRTSIGTVGIIHADVADNMRWDAYTTEIEKPLVNDNILFSTLWSKRRIYKIDETPIQGIERIFVGHTVVPKVTIYGNVFHVDTGAVFGFLDSDHDGHLTLAQLTASHDDFRNAKKYDRISIILASKN